MQIHIEIQKHDQLEGFAAYVVSPQDDGKRVVLLNVYATLAAALEEDISVKELVLTNLMHEFGHAMQQFLDLEFNEDQVERIIASYIAAYGVEHN